MLGFSVESRAVAILPVTCSRKFRPEQCGQKEAVTLPASVGKAASYAKPISAHPADSSEKLQGGLLPSRRPLGSVWIQDLNGISTQSAFSCNHQMPLIFTDRISRIISFAIVNDWNMRDEEGTFMTWDQKTQRYAPGEWMMTRSTPTTTKPANAPRKSVRSPEKAPSPLKKPTKLLPVKPL